MKKVKLLLTAMLSMMAWTGVMAQDTSDADYQAALAAITDGGIYRIKTTVGETDYYVTTSGTLTSVKNNAGYFTITKTSGGYFGTGFRIDSGKRFTNPNLVNSVANLKPGSFATSTNDRTDWERQILYLNGDGKYAVRSCNCQDGTSSWNDAARTHWTYYINNEVVTPCYTYNKDEAYQWEFEGPLTVVNVTYRLLDEGSNEVVSSTTVKQEANSGIITPLPGTGMDFNGFFHEKFYYDYNVSGTIGDTDCTIDITRSEKAGVVKALSDLSNTKAYNIGCDRGAMIAYDGKMVNTALNDATANAQPYGKFALLNYEGNYYIFSVDESKFIKNDASVALDLTTVGFSTEDAIVMEATNTSPYFLWHFNVAGKYLNTNGNAPLGYVINSWSTADEGNQYYMVEAADFDPTAALAELEAYFHPSYFVTYVVKDELGNTIFTSEPQPTKLGATITTLLDEFKRPYYTYNDVDVTISENETTIEFTATWNGPFKLSADFANAQWQNMAIRGTWYVTSAVKDGDGAYKTQDANTMGLVEDSYQWAFIGNGYDGFKVINKAEGDGKSFAYGDVASLNSGSIPTIMDDAEGNHVWKIVASTNTSVPANSFCLGVPGTDLYINQYGGAGGSLKFWNTTGNISDAGSAFTVFDVPTNFASYLVEDGIDAELEATGYFAFTDEAKAALGWNPAYKTECPFEAYKSLKENLPAAKNDLSNFVLPETGYYLLKNKNYGTYMGIDPSDANMYGNYKTATAAKQIVKLTREGSATYTISLMGKYAPATVTKSGQVTASEEAGVYTIVIPVVGFGVFQADPSENMSCLHCAAGGSIVGWEAAAAASQWTVEEATSIEFTIGEEGYATAYMPFPFENAGAVPYDLPTPVGSWTFDDPTNPLAGTGTATLTPSIHGTNATEGPNSGRGWLDTKESLEAASIEVIDGGLYLPKGSSLLMNTNNGAEGFDKYTVMFDICSDDMSGYTPLWQNSMTDSKDGSLFIKNGQMGLGGSLGYNGNFSAGVWYRVVLVIDTPNKAALYVDGELLSACEHTDSYNKHWLLSGPGAVFFADEDGEEKAIKVTGLRFWDVPFNSEQVRILGTVDGEATTMATVPDATGAWTFKGGKPNGKGTATMTASAGVVANEDGSITVAEGERLELTTNLPEETLDTYTLMMDVKFPDVARYTAIIQTDLENTEDAGLFVHNGQIGINSGGLYYHGALENDTWYRIVFVVEDLMAKVYVDGAMISKSSSQLAKWGMSTGLYLFEDEDADNDEGIATVSEIRFWNEALTPAQISQLATVGTEPNLKAYTGKVKNDALTLKEVKGTVPAFTPVVIKAAPNTYIFNITEDVAPITNNDLKGTLEPIDAASKYVLAKPEGEEIGFYLATESKIAAGKAYLEVPSEAQCFLFIFDDNATGLSELSDKSDLSDKSNQSGFIYNLAGQRISKMQKGINIVNGKKVLK